MGHQLPQCATAEALIHFQLITVISFYKTVKQTASQS